MMSLTCEQPVDEFEYFEIIKNLDIALYMSAKGNNCQMDW